MAKHSTDQQQQRSNLLIAAIASAVVLHACSLSAITSLRGAALIELLAITSLAIFLIIRGVGKNERRIASVSIFVSSLVLSLSAPAAFLPVAAMRFETWTTLGGGAWNSQASWISFASWSLSLLIGGLAMHMLITRRWRALPNSPATSAAR